MWCYNIIGDNERSISYILQLDTIISGSAVLTYNLVALKREWRKFIDYFGLSIEADPDMVGKNNIYIYHIGIYQDLHLDISIYQGTICKNYLICNHKRYVYTN